MLTPGTWQEFTVLRATSVGFYLGHSSGEEILLPHKYIAEGLSVGDRTSAFVYKDSEDRFIATNLKPYLELGEYACLEVSTTTSFGAFLNWGLEKDLLLPTKEQKRKLQAGDWVVVHLLLDEETNRLIATSKVDKYLTKEIEGLEEKQEVDILVYEQSDLGFNVIVNNTYRGLVYHNEIHQRLAWGDRLKAYVKLIREDGKIDISLKPLGVENQIDTDAEIVLQTLKEAGGILPFGDKSDPIEIQNYFQLSKKAFKRAAGKLYKDKLIEISDTQIKLH